MNEIALNGLGAAMTDADRNDTAGKTGAAAKAKPAGKSRIQGKTDRERFVALAFCRADLLLELDGDYNIAFAAGVTPGMRPAWPMVSGRTSSSFCFTSLDSPCTAR